MKQRSPSIINFKKSLLGRLTKVTAVGCMLTFVFLVAASPQPKASGTARPLRMSGMVTSVQFNQNYSGEMVVVGTATHLGKFDSYAYWTPNPDGTLHVWATFTAANGDTLHAEFPAFAGLSGAATITGGTGRFAHASGSYVATFSGANSEIFSVEGTISY